MKWLVAPGLLEVFCSVLNIYAGSSHLENPLFHRVHLAEEVLPLREPKWLNEGCTCRKRLHLTPMTLASRADALQMIWGGGWLGRETGGGSPLLNL